MEEEMAKISRALISVSDKTGVVEFAQELRKMGVSIYSTGGTADLLRNNGVNVRDVSDYTKFPELFDGRLKTLHPLVHGGILHRRNNPEDVRVAAKHGILAIDMVVVNLYQFEATIAKPDCTFEEAIENIDIGGPTMLRSGGKNNRDVTVVTDHSDYAPILEEMKASGGCVSGDTNERLMIEVFRRTSEYDAAIYNYLLERQRKKTTGIEVLDQGHSGKLDAKCGAQACAGASGGCGL
jgi:phosphoribosylaminoimidazolecarboxamide formyltransferase/IMP cyclohydrolase